MFRKATAVIAALMATTALTATANAAATYYFRVPGKGPEVAMQRPDDGTPGRYLTFRSTTGWTLRCEAAGDGTDPDKVAALVGTALYLYPSTRWDSASGKYHSVYQLMGGGSGMWVGAVVPQVAGTYVNHSDGGYYSNICTDNDMIVTGYGAEGDDTISQAYLDNTPIPTPQPWPTILVNSVWLNMAMSDGTSFRCLAHWENLTADEIAALNFGAKIAPLVGGYAMFQASYSTSDWSRMIQLHPNTTTSFDYDPSYPYIGYATVPLSGPASGSGFSLGINTGGGLYCNGHPDNAYVPGSIGYLEVVQGMPSADWYEIEYAPDRWATIDSVTITLEDPI